MISELTDGEILDFLMTSDFENKWRYFYRLSQGRLERTKIDAEGNIRLLESAITSLKVEKNILLSKITEGQNVIDSMKNRKLTLKERFSVKIITKDDN